ncbi:hypothetical protein SAMN04488688_107114 [Paenibacillus sp. cl141a]|uniref:small multi-drug export protein n=1 Tax=Paenibacillus sp. cl141a TaxID=1761877 RepID=UPI0008D2FAAC|nr:small multi-drug export protein [Paenibacillus sp. cl141a]SEL95979.1 hypothetical protein SAMN04488688_107114 [Paenibacillus sp. cl141a]
MIQELREFYLSLIPGLEGNLFLQIASIYILSLITFFESYGAIPLLIVLGFPSIPLILSAIAGNIVSVMAFIWVVNKLRSKIVKIKKNKGPSKRAIKAKRYFEKYGVPGVSLAGILLGFTSRPAIRRRSFFPELFLNILRRLRKLVKQEFHNRRQNFMSLLDKSRMLAVFTS